MWERWNSYTPGVGFGDSEMNSFNHYAYGSVVEWMYRYMAGIQADEEKPGFQNIILQPTPDSGAKYNSQERIRSVEGSYDSYYGPIRVFWEGNEKAITSYQVQIPANTTATLYLPTEQSMAEAAKLPAGAAYQGMEQHNGLTCAKFTLASGGYRFTTDGGELRVVYGEGYEGEGDPGDNEKPGGDIKVSSITVKAAKTSLFVKEKTTVKATVTPGNAANKGISWRSSNKSVATVDANGKVTAKKAGTAQIIATATDGSKASGKCTIRVIKPTLKLNAKKVKLQVKKSTAALKASGLQKGDKIKEWRSSNKKIATVAKNGKITAKKTGTVKISAYTAKEASASCTFQIVKSKVKTSKITADVKKLTLKKGKKYQLKISRTPITATEKITYSSSNKKVAAVNKARKITAKKKGKATITAKTSNGKKAKISVIVK